jgi:transposase
METAVRPLGLPSGVDSPTEAPMIREDVVREMLARLARGEGIKRIARELGVDRKTVKAWRRRGGWRPRPIGGRRRALEAFAPFIEARAPEVGWNSVVLHRELQGLGFTGGYLQVQRYLQPLRAARQWAALATVRFETGPGEQAQVDFGQLRVWIGDVETTVHLFVFTLGYSRRLWARAYPHERLDVVLDGHERAFRHFGGVPLTCLYDNPRTQVLGRRERQILWHPVFEDFARYYGYTPRACQPYRARTKGKVESGVKYVKRNALAGRRFASWEARNAWLEEWCLTVADQRVHGPTHQRPVERFAKERLTPLGPRTPYRYEQRRHRRVPADALVAIAAGRYSVPVQYVGTTVTVAETATHYEIFSGPTLIAQHPKRPRFSVTMEPAHYAGLLRGSGVAARPPQADPAYRPFGEVEIRDLATYADLVEVGGGR